MIEYFRHLCLVVQRTDLRQSNTEALCLLQDYESAFKKRMLTVRKVPEILVKE